MTDRALIEYRRCDWLPLRRSWSDPKLMFIAERLFPRMRRQT